MAEFSEVAREYNRMCISFVDNCENCRINPHEGNNIFACRNNVIKHPEKYESLIMQWAAEHPELKYPTWWKYLCMIGVIPDEFGDKTLGEMTVYSLMNTRIQSDIAQKLEIPKEGV